MTQRSVRFMISTVKMLLRKEWVVEVGHMTHLTYSSRSLVVVDLAVCFQPCFVVEVLIPFMHLQLIPHGYGLFDVQVVEAAEEEGKGKGRMLSTLSRFLWRISTMGHQRSYHYLGMCCAQSARGKYAISFFIIFHNLMRIC